MSIDVMKQVLEALDDLDSEKSYWWQEVSDYILNSLNAAQTALRTAIAEAEKQEPVGKVNELFDEAVIELCGFDPELLVYTTPPAAQRQWVGLTDECVKEIREQCDSIVTLHAIKAIEAKLKEKNT
jgi:hypothetical protein